MSLIENIFPLIERDIPIFFHLKIEQHIYLISIFISSNQHFLIDIFYQFELCLSFPCWCVVNSNSNLFSFRNYNWNLSSRY